MAQPRRLSQSEVKKQIAIVHQVGKWKSRHAKVASRSMPNVYLKPGEIKLDLDPKEVRKLIKVELTNGDSLFKILHLR
jgi:hypothetical protein